jgi:hypothetical protein
MLYRDTIIDVQGEIVDQAPVLKIFRPFFECDGVYAVNPVTGDRVDITGIVWDFVGEIEKMAYEQIVEIGEEIKASEEFELIGV